MAHTMRKRCEQDPQLPGAYIFTTIKRIGESKWTNEELEKFVDAIREHGKDFKKVSARIGTKDFKQTRVQVEIMKVKFETNPELPDADILPLLQAKTDRW